MKIVELDTKIFKGKKPRDWHKIVKDYVYNNLAGKTIIIHNEDGSVEEICFARSNERVQKDGIKNSHKVIDKIARNNKNNIRSLVIVQIEEILRAAYDSGTNVENSHQWLDKNGWKFKSVYLLDKNHNKYVAKLNIAITRDDREILYDIQIKKVDDANLSSKRDTAGTSTFSDKNIP